MSLLRRSLLGLSEARELMRIQRRFDELKRRIGLVERSKNRPLEHMLCEAVRL